MGDALDINEAEELFADMGIDLDSELNYKDLAKIMVQPFEPKTRGYYRQCSDSRPDFDRICLWSPKVG